MLILTTWVFDATTTPGPYMASAAAAAANEQAQHVTQSHVNLPSLPNTMTTEIQSKLSMLRP